MIPQSPLGQRSFGRSTGPRHLFTEAIQEWVEVIVFDDKDAIFGMFAVVVRRVVDDLQSQCRLAAPFFTEDHCRRWGTGITKNLVPGRVKCSPSTELLKQRIGLGIFLAERILLQAMVFKKLLDFHRVINFRILIGNRGGRAHRTS